MTINTKFNIKDTVYFLRDNKVCKAQVMYIGVHVRNNDSLIDVRINYDIDIAGGGDLQEHQMFASKDELLKSL